MSVCTERVRVWTSGALGSNNCILDVTTKHSWSILSWAITLLGERKIWDVPWPAKAPGLFAPWANCVFYHTLFFGSLPQSAAVKQAGHLSKPLFPGEESCHLCMCHFCLAALSHLLAHFAWAGEICATCHCLAVWQRNWWSILPAMTSATDGVFTSLCVEKEDNGHESLLSTTDQGKMGLILFLKQEIPFTSPHHPYSADGDGVYITTTCKE